MQNEWFRRSRFGKAFLSLSAGLALAIAAGTLVPSEVGTASALPQLAPAERTADAGVIPASGTFAPVVKKASPAVVSIRSERTAKATNMPEGMPFFFRSPRGQMPERRQQGLGSGVIVTSDGTILTNHHVVDGADEVTVLFSDERELTAEVVGSDKKTDIAVLRVDAEDLPTVPLGNADTVEVGDVVLAIGNPLGVGQTVTMGIVGATGREFGITGGGYEDFIQTDAAINPGNSGGALVNARGELVGINTAIVSRSGGNDGLGFAVPVNLAHHVMTQLVENGRVVRGYMGVGIQDVSAKMAKTLDLPDSKGAVITRVEEDGPADEAGFEAYDVVREIDGKPVDGMRDLRLRIANVAPGERVGVTVLRDGRERDLSIELGELPGEEPVRQAKAESSNALVGVAVEDLTPGIAEQLGLGADVEGVVVSRVKPGSPAAEAGLRRGDVIQEVGRRPVTSAAEFRQAMEDADDAALLMVWSRGGSRLVVIEG